MPKLARLDDRSNHQATNHNTRPQVHYRRSWKSLATRYRSRNSEMVLQLMRLFSMVGTLLLSAQCHQFLGGGRVSPRSYAIAGPTATTFSFFSLQSSARGSGVFDSARGSGVADSARGSGVADSGRGSGVADSARGSGVTFSGRGAGVTFSGRGAGVTVSG